jgi:hypothetical protein
VKVNFDVPHEDDGERVVRVGVDIVAAVERVRAPKPRKVWVGVATDLVVVGDLIGEGGALERAEVDDIPNLAGRLHAPMEPGTMLLPRRPAVCWRI